MTSVQLIEAIWNCKKCNSLNNPSANYCGNCGSKSPIQTIAIAPVPQMPAQEITVIQSTNIVSKSNLQQSFLDPDTDRQEQSSGLTKIYGNSHFALHINKPKCVQHLQGSWTYYMTLIFVCVIIFFSMYILIWHCNIYKHS